MVKLFEKTQAGLLQEIAPELADKAREGRRFTRIANAEYDVLWTPEEEAVRDAEEAADILRRAEQAKTARMKSATREAAIAKLGLTDEEREALDL